jgi:hypothetical protein
VIFTIDLVPPLLQAALIDSVHIANVSGPSDVSD